MPEDEHDEITVHTEPDGDVKVEVQRAKPPQSTVFGTVLMGAGTAVFLLWMLDLMGVYPLVRELPVVVTITMTVFGLGFGWMLVRGEGDSIADAAMSWFRSKGSG